MNFMLKVFKIFIVFFASMFGLGAEIHLDRLIEYDQQTCTEILREADLRDVWNCFLKGQADLFFNKDAELLMSEKGWTTAKNILELGSGTGAYLFRLSEIFKDKNYLGLEKQSTFVQQSNIQFGRAGLLFIEGDAEEENEHYNNQFDVVLYRLTLQHLKDPKRSLQIAYQYLKQDGCVIIIDSYDPAKSSSHPMPSMEEATRQHNERNKTTLKGNRRITIEILEDLQNGNGPLFGLYEVTRTSLDVEGNRLEKGIRFESEEDRKRYFNHALLFLTILSKEYDISVDFSKAYEELQVYLEDQTSWVCPGLHFLVLKKL